MFKGTLKLRPRPLLCGALIAMSMMANAGVTLKTGADTKLSEVINSIQKQSDYKFFYDDEIAKYPVKQVTLKDDDISAALKKLFGGTSISYVIKDHVIYLKKNDIATPEKGSAKSKKRTISGVIHDEFGDPLVGATVKIKGSNIGGPRTLTATIQLRLRMKTR